MSNAEEIAEQLGREHNEFYQDQKYAGWANLIDEIAQAHTNQTLDKLKAKVIDEQEEIANTNLIRKEDVITLIDEAINE